MPHSILVENVSKSYQLGEAQHTMLRDALMGAFRKLTGRKNEQRSRELIWALNDVSLEVKRGEVIGLIGRNGAGKSTLLKVLSRITYPTSGRINVHGRVGSLLEVGTGFHDELTGRENIFLNGSILGMKRREIAAAMDQIIEFADIGDFLDTPIKRYSSGMRMRLGFSVAAHLSTDVLFVDEVLAVGDAAFQKKCLGAMRDLADGGRTVIFVSHNLAAVENLCQRSVWLSNGRAQMDGDTRAVIKAYLDSFGGSREQGVDLAGARERHGKGDIRLTKMEILDQEGQKRGVVHSGDRFTIRLHYESRRDVPNPVFGVRFYTNLGTLVHNVNSFTTGLDLPVAARGPGCVEVEIDHFNLMPGSYHIGLWVYSMFEALDELHNVAVLDVEPSDYYGTGRGVEPRFGLVLLPYRWRVAAEAPAEEPATEPDLAGLGSLDGACVLAQHSEGSR